MKLVLPAKVCAQNPRNNGNGDKEDDQGYPNQEHTQQQSEHNR